MSRPLPKRALLFAIDPPYKNLSKGLSRPSYRLGRMKRRDSYTNRAVRGLVHVDRLPTFLTLYKGVDHAGAALCKNRFAWSYGKAVSKSGGTRGKGAVDLDGRSTLNGYTVHFESTGPLLAGHIDNPRAVRADLKSRCVVVKDDSTGGEGRIESDDLPTGDGNTVDLPCIVTFASLIVFNGHINHMAAVWTDGEMGIAHN